jgi:6-phosphofructokinase 1
MKFAVMTGGGDGPGMNAFVRAVVRSAKNLRPTTNMWGVIDGWRGLVDNDFKSLTQKDTRGIAKRGGTMLGTLRVPELAHDEDLQRTIAINLHDNFIDYLFMIGGNGSLKAANVVNNIIKKEGLRTKILAASGSIDNDVANRYGFSVGFYSAIDKSLEMLEWIRDTASAHRRVYVIKSMGRDSGYLAFYAGVATGAEHIILPNEEVDYDKLATLIDERDRDTRVIVSEGYPKSLEEIRKILEEIFTRRNITHEIRTVDMGYFQRGGAAAAKDILLASWLAYKMVVDAYNKCDSAFYSAYNIGQEPVRLSLEDAVNDDLTNSMEIPKDMIDFALAMK